MRIAIIAALAGLCLVAAGCSKPTQDKAAQDLKAVGSDVGAAAKDVAHAPAAQSLGADIKQGASEAADKTKEAAGKAGEKIKAGASEAGDKLKTSASDAGDKLKAGAKDAAAKTDQAVRGATDDSKK